MIRPEREIREGNWNAENLRSELDSAENRGSRQTVQPKNDSPNVISLSKLKPIAEYMIEHYVRDFRSRKLSDERLTEITTSPVASSK
jgi:hypothetical protein